jgi:predicted outer membrane repeat protein
MNSCVATVLIVVCAASAAWAGTLHVPGDFDDIADAIAAAANGDTVLVHPGTYTGAGNRALDFGGKSLALVAEGGPEVTVIDCEGADRGLYFHTGEDSTSVVSGFTILNGSALRGGGIHCDGASPVIDSCVFKSNSATEAGGGIYCFDAAPKVRHCEFRINTVTTAGYGHGGGGMQCNASSPVIHFCEFNENSASSGGGLYCVFGASPTVLDCVFEKNLAYEHHGGGMFCFEGSTPTVSRCDFVWNDAERNGGGIYCEDSSPEISSCTFRRNEVLVAMSNFGGGGIALVRSAPTILECEFASNYAARGGGVSCRDNSHPGILNSFFTANTANAGAGVYCVENSMAQLNGDFFEGGVAISGGGLYADEANPWVTDCIFFGNVSSGTDEAHGGGAVHLYKAVVSISSSAFIGNVGVRGGAVHVREAAAVSVLEATFAANRADYGSGLYGRESNLILGNSIVAFGQGEAVTCVDPLDVVVSCTDVFGNTGGDWTGCIASLYGVAGNISANPLFCGGGDLDEAYMLHDNSPCASVNSPCGQMGKWDVGCPATPVEVRSWGEIKAMYR